MQMPFIVIVIVIFKEKTTQIV